MKRWGFRRWISFSRRMKKCTATPGSIGCNTKPGRVIKGKKMAGHMGDRKTSYKNIEVVAVRAKDNLAAGERAIPGPKNGLVIVRKQQA
jgi:large subunit ribosomal protein L3